MSLSIEHQIEEACKPGQILHLTCNFTNPSKEKFLVLVSCEPVRLFIINSVINPFIQKNPTLLSCQVKLKASDYKFLDYDSYIDCSEFKLWSSLEEIKNQLRLNINNIKIQINDSTKKEILKATSNSKLYSLLQKNIIIANLS